MRKEEEDPKIGLRPGNVQEGQRPSRRWQRWSRWKIPKVAEKADLKMDLHLHDEESGSPRALHQRRRGQTPVKD